MLNHQRCVALQDAWCIQEQLAGQDMVMFGVFDGHGQEGKVVSHHVCTNVPKALAKHTACKVGLKGGRSQVTWQPDGKSRQSFHRHDTAELFLLLPHAKCVVCATSSMLIYS